MTHEPTPEAIEAFQLAINAALDAGFSFHRMVQMIDDTDATISEHIEG